MDEFARPVRPFAPCSDVATADAPGSTVTAADASVGPEVVLASSETLTARHPRRQFVPGSSRIEASSRLAAVEALGYVTWLMTRSRFHRNWPLAAIKRLVMPPIRLRQFRLYLHERTPVGFASWALLDAESERGLLDQTRKLEPKDWDAGDRLWLIDFVAPFGGAKEVARDLKSHRRRKYPHASVIRAIRRNRNGTINKVVELGLN